LRFGAAQLDVAQRRLLIDGQPAKLGARAFDVLLALLERRDRTVNKNELFDLVWPGVVVEENNLQVHISTLRKVLGPQTIATIPGRGYRFTGDLTATTTAAPVAPPPSTVAATMHLTAQQPLYGRDGDMHAVGELLRRHTHVSIVGAGGMGKTRLALAVAAAQREQFPDGIWWIELAALSDGGLVTGAIAQALGVRGGNDRPVLETVIALLLNQTALLVLDNCEHLLDAAAECVNTLLLNAPALRILVTSQAALRTATEHVYPLSGLPSNGVPNATAPAVELFVARARASAPHLQLNAAILDTVAEICRGLDGMPLAIELAAARVQLLGIEGVRARLDERFLVLTGGTRGVIRRHQTLRAALEWSHGLLAPAEQTVFRRLGVFVGGFTLDLAQDVASDERTDRWAVLDLLGQLVDKSLVVADGDAVPRYRLLETMRAFALEKLAGASETPGLMRRHAEALLNFLSQVELDLNWNVDQTIRCKAERDNLRAALGWGESKAGDRPLACALMGNSSRIWISHELMNEGIERALRLMPLPENLTPEIEARFNLTLGTLGFSGTRRECFDASVRAADMCRSLGNTPLLVEALIAVAQSGARLGEGQQCAAAIAEAKTLIGPDTPGRQAATLARAEALNHMSLGQYGQAVESALRQVAIYRDSGDEFGAQRALIIVAMMEGALNRFDSAIERLHAALDVLRRTDSPYGIGEGLQVFAGTLAMRGDRDAALAAGLAAVPHAQRGSNTATLLLFIGLVHARHGAADRAAKLVGYVDREYARTGRIISPLLIQVRDEILVRAKAELGPFEFDRQTAAGAALSEDRALTLAFDPNAHRST